MKNPIYKRAYRQIYFHPSRVLPIFIALCFIIIFSSSFFTAQDSTKKLYYDLIDKGKVEDGNFTCLDKLDDKSFEYKAELDGHKAIATAKTKKAAQQMAAKKLAIEMNLIQ